MTPHFIEHFCVAGVGRFLFAFCLGYTREISLSVVDWDIDLTCYMCAGREQPLFPHPQADILLLRYTNFSMLPLVCVVTPL